MKEANTMETLGYSAFRSHLAGIPDKVNDDHKPVLVTRQNGKPAVVMSLEDFQACEETACLMASPENMRRLNEAVSEVREGRTVQHGIMVSLSARHT